ncbi:MAG TPA: hypothetical protein VE201_09565 [Nitrospirales bacterium]|jgi:hypothetical protein|nr:hypothetical protein [Nitrospirales bacterium]
MEGLLTHVATTDCFVTQPHPALKCGIVTAWWRCQEEDTARRRQPEDEQREQNDQARV